jgi:acetoin utilization protein AcuC
MAVLIYSPTYARYDFGGDHPFSPVRVEMTLDLLRRLGVHLRWQEPEAASREDVRTVHEEGYVRTVEALSTGAAAADAAACGLGTPDTPAFPGMDEAARILVGGTLLAAKLIASGSEQRVLQLGGGLHHARPGHAAGFCVYHDLAIAIRHLVEAGFWVTYLDLDVHHGDGVQAVFYADDKVQTISLHESGKYLFPGTGEIHELGEGVGRGLTINVPLEAFTEGESYLEAFERIVPAAVESFGPQVLVVQAGADAHFDDPLADLALTTRTYEQLFRRILGLADLHCAGRVLFTLGGGYSAQAAARVWALLYLTVNDLPVPDLLPDGWREAWARHLHPASFGTLHDPLPPHSPIPRREEIERHNRVVTARLRDALSRYWY